MRVAFRTDASLDIGTGHVMRCLTLADELRERGANCHFLCRAHPGNMIDQIRLRGHEADALPLDEDRIAQRDRLPAHAPWLGTDWATDTHQTLAALGDQPVDWMVVDHYALDSRWENALRQHYGKLLVIDDLADRAHSCDLLLDQNLGREPVDYANLVPENCAVLAGPRFALLRPEFAALREYSLQRRESPALKHLLITMGGVDQPNATGQVLEALRTCPLPADCKITVVMGRRAPWLEQIREIAATLPWPTEVRVDISDMAQVMADSDLAIGAAGTTSWERCSLGLPALMVVLAENQWPGAQALLASGAASLIGEASAIREQLELALIPLLAAETAAKMSRFASNITDGQGCVRVVEHMKRQQ